MNATKDFAWIVLFLALLFEQCLGALELPANKVSAGNLVSSGGRAPPVQSPPLKEAGVYEIGCRRHAWERAWLLVVEHPYAACSARSAPGVFALEGVPAGRWSLSVWHPALEPVERSIEVEIKENQSAEVSIPFKPPRGLLQNP
jgi:hypothetical protein